MKRALGISVVAAAVWACSATGVQAESLPAYGGAMTFQSIQGPDGPEEFSWVVGLDEEQELRAIDDRHAAVYYTDPEHLAFGIEAVAAHDAIGTTVPTTLSVTQPNVITLIVHHSAGNPAAGFGPFDYPVDAGAGWEGGFQSHEIDGPPSPVAPQVAPLAEPEAPRCTVPELTGRTLKASHRQLRRAHCKLGEVRGERSRGARVAKQFRPPGRSLPDGTEVGVKLLRGRSGRPGPGLNP